MGGSDKKSSFTRNLKFILPPQKRRKQYEDLRERYRKKWYKVKFKNLGSKPTDFCYMIAQMITLWFRQTILESVTPAKLRKSLCIITAISLVVGIISLIIGAAHIRGHENPLDPNPYHPVARSHYIGLAIMGSLKIVSSLFGFAGIFRKNIKFTKGFAMISFIYGYFLTTVYISWLAKIYFVRILNILEEENSRDKFKNTPAKALLFGDKNEEDYDTIIYTLTYFYMNLILVAAQLQLASGVLTIWLLVLHTQKQGYIPMYRRIDQP